MLRYDLRTVHALLLEESFDAFWSYKTVAWAKWFLDRWCTRAMRSRLVPTKRLPETLRAHQSLLLNLLRRQENKNCPPFFTLSELSSSSRAEASLALAVALGAPARGTPAQWSWAGPCLPTDALASNEVHEAIGHDGHRVARLFARRQAGWHADAYGSPIAGLFLDESWRAGQQLYRPLRPGAAGPALRPRSHDDFAKSPGSPHGEPLDDARRREVERR